MRRREFIAGLLLPLAQGAVAQTDRVRRLGILWPGASDPPSPRMESIRQGLGEAGFIEGQNLTIELRYSDRGFARLHELADELVRLDVDVISAFGDLAPRAAQIATARIPITAIADDVLGANLVASLARPGGNTTGITILSPELSAKRLAVLKEMIPDLGRVAALWDPNSGKSQIVATEDAARSMNLTINIVEVRSRNDVAGAFKAAKEWGAEAVNVLSSPFLASLYLLNIEHAAAHRLPAIFQWKEHVQEGGLASYGAGLADMFRQTGHLVAKLLKGAIPGNLPVEQPTKFEFAVNLRTAKALGLTIPATLVARADEVIE